ncbi:hypothetical protein BC830DRAFT_1109958 [Chytriomyces sp. MP71]|nr:hypothetical protein BC830DRAFT_1109958 [Chytriomyces sp. MP71]
MSWVDIYSKSYDIIEITESDLSCCVRFDKLNLPFIQCANGGNHFVCTQCFCRTQYTCPMCKTDSLFNNMQPAMKLQPFMGSCSIKNCQVKTLRWNMNSH